ncbi:21378_t:CDS:1, partial [Gigaspora margarita]
MAPICTLYSESTNAKNFQGHEYKLDSSRERELESQYNELLLETKFFANKYSEFRNAKALAEVQSDMITKELKKKNDKILHLQKKLNQYINNKNQNDLIKKQLKEEIKELKSKNTNLTEYKAKYY